MDAWRQNAWLEAVSFKCELDDNFVPNWVHGLACFRCHSCYFQWCLKLEFVERMWAKHTTSGINMLNGIYSHKVLIMVVWPFEVRLRWRSASCPTLLLEGHWAGGCMCPRCGCSTGSSSWHEASPRTTPCTQRQRTCMVMMPHSRLKSWNEQHNCQPDLPPGLDFIKTAACIIEQLQLQLQLQLQGLHGAFCNTMAKTYKKMARFASRARFCQNSCLYYWTTATATATATAGFACSVL